MSLSESLPPWASICPPVNYSAGHPKLWVLQRASEVQVGDGWEEKNLEREGVLGFHSWSSIYPLYTFRVYIKFHWGKDSAAYKEFEKHRIWWPLNILSVLKNVFWVHVHVHLGTQIHTHLLTHPPRHKKQDCITSQGSCWKRIICNFLFMPYLPPKAAPRCC